MRDIEFSSCDGGIEGILSTVKMDHVLMEYERLLEQMEILHPSQCAVDLGALVEVPEDAFIVLPSPFQSERGRGCVIVLLRNNRWTDGSGLRPADIPPDPAGFVMAYDACSYDQAIKKLQLLASDIRGHEATVNTYVAQIRGLTAVCAEAALARGRGVSAAEAARPN